MLPKLLHLLLFKSLTGVSRRASGSSSPSLPRRVGTVAGLTFFTATLILVCSGAQGQCPAVGNDTGCGTILTITDAGVTISATGQGPYVSGGQGAGSTGSLIGVINNSSKGIYSMALSSPYGVFAFVPGYGIDNFGVSGNGQDITGYGGPNAYFTNISGSEQQGTVNFLTPIAAEGGTGFFSLADDLTQLNASACASAINNTVAPTVQFTTSIVSSFTPNNGLTLSQAAAACGFDEWNWQQLVTNLPLPSPFYDAATFTNLLAPLPFNDPPPSGYSYQYQEPGTPDAVGLPIYYNLSGMPAEFSLVSAEPNAYTLNFGDQPADNCLAGGNPFACAPAYPGGPTVAPARQALAFSTHLVGLIGTSLTAEVVDTGIGFTWTDNFNGTSGGVSVLSNPFPLDPNSGTGGITVTGVSPLTDRRFPQTLRVILVNGSPVNDLPPLQLLSKTQLITTASGLSYSRADRLFTGTITLQNVSDHAIAGPFQIVLLGLSAGASLGNASGTFGGAPFLALPGTSTLAAGATLTAPVRFSDPSMNPIRFSPATYTGGFN